jgi:hypothetical protein
MNDETCIDVSFEDACRVVVMLLYVELLEKW